MRIKELLKEKHITQKELAARMGISDGTLSNILSGRFSPTKDTLQRIADALGVDIAELFTPVVRCPHCGHVLRIRVDEN